MTGYELRATRFDGSPERVISLEATRSEYSEDTAGRATCYQLIPTAGSTPLGTSDRLCAVPGVSTLGSTGYALQEGWEQLQRFTEQH